MIKKASDKQQLQTKEIINAAYTIIEEVIHYEHFVDKKCLTIIGRELWKITQKLVTLIRLTGGNG
jgi:hypothetical protein